MGSITDRLRLQLDKLQELDDRQADLTNQLLEKVTTAKNSLGELLEHTEDLTEG